jgi:hypothetical protein
MKRRAAELFVANKELAFQNQESDSRVNHSIKNLFSNEERKRHQSCNAKEDEKSIDLKSAFLIICLIEMDAYEWYGFQTY